MPIAKKQDWIHCSYNNTENTNLKASNIDRVGKHNHVGTSNYYCGGVLLFKIIVINVFLFLNQDYETKQLCRNITILASTIIPEYVLPFPVIWGDIAGSINRSSTFVIE